MSFHGSGRTLGDGSNVEHQEAPTSRRQAMEAEIPASTLTGVRREVPPKIKGSLLLSEVDILFVAAIILEANAVIAILDKIYENDLIVDGALFLRCGVLAGAKVAILSLTDPGMYRSSVDTQRLSVVLNQQHARSILIIATGICGGVGYVKASSGKPKDVFLGDVIISRRVCKYVQSLRQEGETTSVHCSTRLGDFHTIPADQRLRSMLHSLDVGTKMHEFCEKVNTTLDLLKTVDKESSFLERYGEDHRPETQPPVNSEDLLFNADYPHLHRGICRNNCDPETGHACNTAKDSSCQAAECDKRYARDRGRFGDSQPPKIFMGPYGSEDCILRSPITRDKLYEDGLVDVEMEGRGIWHAGLESKHNVVIIKGVADYADTHKQKDWQPYAATTAACAQAARITMQHEEVLALPEQRPSATDNSRTLTASQVTPRGTNKRLEKDDYTVAWICGESKSDLDAAICMLDDEHLDPSQRFHGNNIYRFGAITVEDETTCRNVVIACVEPQQHRLTATNTSHDIVGILQLEFPNLEAYLSVGTGAGIPCSPSLANPQQDVHLGDVVVGSAEGNNPALIFYDPPGGVSTGSVLPLPPRHLLGPVANMSGDEHMASIRFQKTLRRLERKKGFGRPHNGTDKLYRADFTCADTPNKILCQCDETQLEGRPARRGIGRDFVYHQGTILCQKPFKPPVYRAHLASTHPEALCIETRAPDLPNGIQILVIRGISHYADSHTNRLWWMYAAGTAATFTRELIRKMGEPRVVGRENMVDKTFIFNSLRESTTDNSFYYANSKSDLRASESCIGNDPSKTEAIQGFPRFRNLPVELRYEIWSFCIPDQLVIVLLDCDPHRSRDLRKAARSQRRLPTISQVCHEAREVTLSSGSLLDLGIWTLEKEGYCRARGLDPRTMLPGQDTVVITDQAWFNPKKDTLGFFGRPPGRREFNIEHTLPKFQLTHDCMEVLKASNRIAFSTLSPHKRLGLDQSPPFLISSDREDKDSRIYIAEQICIDAPLSKAIDTGLCGLFGEKNVIMFNRDRPYAKEILDKMPEMRIVVLFILYDIPLTPEESCRAKGTTGSRPL
ncbi:hypothetical protein VMCG_04478 [Cytospora schulzeri]|uniref:2EXR domain-containing protein n=1 Tax=Cytospora schulzeri TaxID=448051 RepID=A0A423WRK1_9PEZI|nr:hypothetical protein VMCG_04478 [Valsa malicola]